MKLLLKQEAELRQTTRHVLISQPVDEQSISELKARNDFLSAQLEHSFHINEQVTNALTEQFLIIQDRETQIKTLSDEIEYLRAYTLNQLSLFQDDLISAYDSTPDFRPAQDK